jgi:hypothetical protein
MVGWAKVRIAGTLVLSLLPGMAWGVPGQKKQNPDRPKLPYSMLGLHREDIDAYDSKAEPVARVTEALLRVNQTGWELIHKYFPTLGTSPVGAEKKVHPEDPADRRFFASYANEDPSLNPMPLLCMIWSLPESQLSGPLKNLHDELVPTMALEDYPTWKLDELRKAVDKLTVPATTVKGVKYRTPKTSLLFTPLLPPNAGIDPSMAVVSKMALSFRQALHLYAMTLALVRMETKWADKADSPPPNMVDFTNRLKRQLPVQIPDGETATLFLYLPAGIGQPIAKGEKEERADVVVMKRKGTAFEVEQFPVYLTADRKEWDPSWIELADEVNDSSLIARKYEHDWTRLDGPFLWFRPDQLNGEVVYRATVKFQPGEIMIEAERSIEHRGAVKRADRPSDYDPGKMTAFSPGVDTPAMPADPLSVEPVVWTEQFNGLKWPAPYFSNGFRTWCAYGRWTTGLADDGKTWIVVGADTPRKAAPVSTVR